LLVYLRQHINPQHGATSILLLRVLTAGGKGHPMTAPAGAPPLIRDIAKRLFAPVPAPAPAAKQPLRQCNTIPAPVGVLTADGKGHPMGAPPLIRDIAKHPFHAAPASTALQPTRWHNTIPAPACFCRYFYLLL
jgi:hypothetical protein